MYVKIPNTLLDTGYLYPLMRQTLDMYHNGEDLTKSPVAEWGRQTVTAGHWWYGVKPADMEPGIAARLKAIVGLYEGIKKHGYIGSDITIKFNEDGRCIVHDGYHRLCIMRYLNMQVKVRCRIKQDFPLLETLRELNKGENLYQPTGDPRTHGWRIWRTDSQARFNMMAPYLTGSTVLDGGCETGYFCRKTAAHGYEVTGVDYQPKRLAVARYLALMHGLKCTFIDGAWHEAVKNETFDNVLLLSVLHHQAIKEGAGKTLKTLSCLAGRCKRLFVEFPLESEGVTWLNGGHRWSYNHQELAMYLEAVSGMKVKVILETASINRPIIVLEAAA